MRHSAAFPERPLERHTLPVGGLYQWRADGEFHLFNPETIHRFAEGGAHGAATRRSKSYSKLIDRAVHPPVHAAAACSSSRPATRCARGSRARRVAGEALQDRRHVVRLDQQGGARDARQLP